MPAPPSANWKRSSNASLTRNDYLPLSVAVGVCHILKNCWFRASNIGLEFLPLSAGLAITKQFNHRWTQMDADRDRWKALRTGVLESGFRQKNLRTEKGEDLGIWFSAHPRISLPQIRIGPCPPLRLGEPYTPSYKPKATGGGFAWVSCLAVVGGRRTVSFNLAFRANRLAVFF
jgi:hypothetical protein